MLMDALNALWPVIVGDLTSLPILGKASNLTAKLALVIVACSVSLWITRQVYLFLKRNGRNALQVALRSLLLFLRQSHPFFGWLVLATATIHAAYYFLRIPVLTTRIETGIVAWIILCCLVAFGLRYQLSLRRKSFRRSIRLWHVLTVIIFLLVLVVHV